MTTPQSFEECIMLVEENWGKVISGESYALARIFWYESLNTHAMRLQRAKAEAFDRMREHLSGLSHGLSDMVYDSVMHELLEIEKLKQEIEG